MWRNGNRGRSNRRNFAIRVIEERYLISPHGPVCRIHAGKKPAPRLMPSCVSLYRPWRLNRSFPFPPPPQESASLSSFRACLSDQRQRPEWAHDVRNTVAKGEARPDSKNQQSDDEAPKVDLATISQAVLTIGADRGTAKTVEKQKLISRIDNRMNTLAEHRRAAGPDRGSELRQRYQKISCDRGVDHCSGRMTCRRLARAHDRSSSVISPPFRAAASANRANAGRDFEPVFFMTPERWLSTVRWLMPRSAAIFLLG